MDTFRRIRIDGTQIVASLGSSVSLSSDGTILAIGDHTHLMYQRSSTINEGAAFVYQYNGSSWIPLGTRIDYININGITSDINSFFGYSVSLSSDGTTLAVGATGFDVTGSNSEGAVFVYQYNGSSWVTLGGQIDYVNTNGIPSQTTGVASSLWLFS